MIVYLNKCSNNGRGLTKWQGLKSEFEKKFPGKNYSLISERETFTGMLRKECAGGERVIVAAGGDGTVNFVLNRIMQMKESERKQVILGAVGLGSSNDFHKPFNRDGCLKGNVPVRLDYKNAYRCNVARVDYEDEEYHWQRKYFIINFSFGVIAYANFLFNSQEMVIDFFKSKWVMGAIWYAGLKTLFRAPNVPAEIKIGKKTFMSEVSNLSVVINPHFSGNFCYDIDVSPRSDFLGAALCEGLGKFARLRTFFSLAKGRFSALPGARVWKIPGIEIYSGLPAPLELDGEVYIGRRIKIKLLKGGINVCR